VPAPYRPAPLRGLRALPEHAADGLAHRCAALADDIALVDHAELSGQLALHPRRLRDRGHAAGVDPDLVPCALDTLAEQVVPIRIVVGNEAVVRRVDAAFFASRRGLDWQYLRADHVTLRLDTRAVDSAWVFQPSDLPAAPRQLRLYDRDGLAIAVLSPAPRDGHGEHHMWTTLIDALLQ
jgi:putative heme degradation protein